MALGINSTFDNDHLYDCPGCEVEPSCCADSCEARLWVAVCGSIDYATGELKPDCRFYEPRAYKLSNFDDNLDIREKSYQGCKTFRLAGDSDPSFDVEMDVCQGDAGQNILMGRCPFDYVYSPIGNNINFDPANDGNLSIWDQRTKIWWGRALGGPRSWQFPDKECQTMTRTIFSNGYCYETELEGVIASQDAA